MIELLAQNAKPYIFSRTRDKYRTKDDATSATACCNVMKHSALWMHAVF
jgi:hypothetical protein